MYEALLAADVIITDKMSMLTAFFLCLVMYRIGQLYGCPCAALDNKLILLVGDHAQLPPVCSGHHGSFRKVAETSIQKDIVCLQCHISSSISWPQIVFHHLIINLRQCKDPGHMEFLSIIRHRRPTQDEIDAALSSCFVSKDDALALANIKTTVLCTHNEDVVRLNKAILRRLFPEECIVQVPLRTDAPGEPFLSEWLKNTDFHTLTEVAIGALVMITNNINLSIGASNGAKGIVENISDEEGLVSKIDVRILSSGKHLGVRSKAKCATFYHNSKS